MTYGGVIRGQPSVRQPVASPGTTVPVFVPGADFQFGGKPAPLITTHFHQSRRLLTQAEDSDGVRRQSRTDCTSINMRYTPHGPKTHAVQRNTLINTMIHPNDTNNQANGNSTNGLRIPTTSGRIRERAIEIGLHPLPFAAPTKPPSC